MSQFLVKILLLIGLVALFQGIIALRLLPVTRQEMIEEGANRLERLQRLSERGVDILYFSDSVNCFTHKADTDTRPISDMLSDSVSWLKVGVVDHPAYHMGIFDAYYRYLVRKQRWDLKLIIVPVNLRSFSVTWIGRPAWQFGYLLSYLERDSWAYRIAFRPLKGLRFITNSANSDTEFSNMSFRNGDKIAGKVQDIGHSQSNQITAWYMYRLTADHPRLRSLESLASLALSSGVKMLVYITPINAHAGERLFGEEFRARLAENKALIRKVAHDHGMEVLDLSSSLPSQHFISQEHLKQSGRRFVAEQLRRRLNCELGR